MRKPSVLHHLAFIASLFAALLGCSGSSFCPDCGKATAVTSVSYPSSGSSGGVLALNASEGAAFSVQAAVSGGTATSFMIVDGSLPPGLALATGTGAITGTPTAPGAYTATIQAGNVGGSSSVVLTITVAAKPTASLAASASTVTRGGSTTLVPTFTGGTATLGTGGAGSTDLAGSATNGVAVGTGVLTAATTFTLTVTNQAGVQVTAARTVTVVDQPTAALSASTTEPLHGATNVTLMPTFTGAVRATLGTSQGGTEIASALASGIAVPVQGTGFRTATSYWLRATNAAGDSTDASVTVTPQTVVLSGINPAGVTAGPRSASYAVTVAGGAAGAVTWGASGGSWSGSTWTSPSTAGTYDIVATSVDDPSVSLATTATVSAPVFTTQPQSGSACLGGSLELTAAAAYATSYAWYKDGIAIGGATAASYTVPCTAYLSGTFVCKASNGAGTTSSSPVTVTVGSAITTQPQSLTASATQTATFSVAATGRTPFTYQWYKGSDPIAGATSSTYTTPALATSDAGTYQATVTDACGTTLTSSAATLTVNTNNVPPTITVQPVGQTATVGGTATFTVTATGSGTLSYAWYRIPYGEPNAGIRYPVGTDSGSYTVPASATLQGNDGDHYFVVVTNAYGQAVSINAQLAVGDGVLLQITGQPRTAYVAYGGTATFTVTASCTDPGLVGYQWYQCAPGSASFTAIGGATGSTCTISDATSAQSGLVLRCVVSSSAAGTNLVTSQTAALWVGSVGSVSALCSGNGWVLNGRAVQETCAVQLTTNSAGQSSSLFWPTLISTANFSVSFKITMGTSMSQPADGFTLVLADPSLGATTGTIGGTGGGLGARGIPGFVLGFDTYYNSHSGTIGTGDYQPTDPAVPYLGVGRGETLLWEQPWTYVNQNLSGYPGSTSNWTSAYNFCTSTHTYVVNVVDGTMSVTMDGVQAFSGQVSPPPAAYLGFTASTGGNWEQVVISDLSAIVSAP